MNIVIVTLLLAIVYFAIGSLWYSSLLFGNLWKKEVKISDKEMKEANMAVLMGSSFLCMLVLVFAMIRFFGYSPSATLLENTRQGFLAAILIAVPISTINHVYEGKSLILWFINVGYMIIGLSATGFFYHFLA